MNIFRIILVATTFLRMSVITPGLENESVTESILPVYYQTHEQQVLRDLPGEPNLTPTDDCVDCQADADRLRMLTTLTVNQVRDTQIEKPVVHVILFWMKGCPHCHNVIENVLPPLQEKYKDQLEVLQVEIVTVDDVQKFLQVGEAYGFPKNSIGVPFLIIGDHTLMGDAQIPAELPGLIESYLAEGGVDFPDKPEISIFIPQEQEEEERCAPFTSCDDTQEPGSTQTLSATQEFISTVETKTNSNNLQSPPPPISKGFGLAIVIMVGMLIAIIYSGIKFVQGGDVSCVGEADKWVNPITLALIIIGFLVAGYLSYVEVFEVTAICGPVGDCNAVQSSPYAKLFGLIPIGVIGMAGYVGMFIALVLRKSKNEQIVEYANMSLFGMAFFGTFFSLYLTYLEPFVIHAVCAWCLTSTVVITLIMVLNAKYASLSVSESDGE
ncbi:MAG TPA: hypothetical protein G4N95_03300 [Anaerolineae bacterium]|nr:hypothetical protein [Anaerolineae bacterium]